MLKKVDFLNSILIKNIKNTIINMLTNPPCSGIIIINNDEVILVNTSTGNYSFPKGKKTKMK